MNPTIIPNNRLTYKMINRKMVQLKKEKLNNYLIKKLQNINSPKIKIFLNYKMKIKD